MGDALSPAMENFVGQAQACRRLGSPFTAELCAAPLAWLRFGNHDRPDSGRIELTIWPGGDNRVLGRADFHGRWAEWAGA